MSGHSRREFAKTLAVAAVALPLVAEETKPAPIAEAQVAVVKAEYGEFLTMAELEQMRKDFNDSAPYLQKFRDFKLSNADEPDFTFGALVKRW
jgi:hypothetical protein